MNLIRLFVFLCMTWLIAALLHGCGNESARPEAQANTTPALTDADAEPAPDTKPAIREDAYRILIYDAVKTGDLDLVKAIIATGADLNLTDRNGFVALHHASL
ncbi:MAG TPA: ankyrin repeat domain-containing protein, partial [Phycisphaerales bacterium]|nr:ankyrin repeat domain-containing protein [Phycisphaerales bacterium]